MQNFLGDRRVLAGIVIALAVVGSIILILPGAPDAYSGPVPTKFTVDGKTYTFSYAAVNSAQRQAGLMGKKITGTTFMLFAWPAPGRYQFWMYDTNTSLDMIWISASGGAGTVVYVVSNAQPCYDPLTCPTFTPAAPANFVIESKAGFASANNVTTGTEVSFG